MFFFPCQPKVPVTQILWNFVSCTFDFSRAYYWKLSRERSKISRSFFPKLPRASWKIHGHRKIIVTGTLAFVTGSFVLWSPNFWFTALTTKLIFGVSFVGSGVLIFSVKKKARNQTPISLTKKPFTLNIFEKFSGPVVKISILLILMKHRPNTLWQVHFSLQGIGLIEKVYEINGLTLLKVGVKLQYFQRAARYFFEILTGCFW